MLNLKLFRVIPLLLILLFGGAKLASAQSADVYFGLGTATDKSTGQTINTFGDGTLYPTPKMTGVFGTFGASYLLRPTLGFGGEYSARFAQGAYAGLNYRPKFYDFNAIWMPLGNSKTVAPEFQAGIGGASLSFYFPSQCGQFGCSSSQFLQSSNHFQTHLGAGLRIYARGGFYVRPQFDVHYVRNLFQFGSNWVPQYSVVFGYSFGRQ